MAFKHGRLTKAYYGGIDLGQYLRSIDFSATPETVDVTTLGDDWREHMASLLAATVSAEGLYDPGQTALDDALGASGVLTFSIGGGTAIGDPAFLVPVLQTALGTSDTLDDAVTFAWEATADDAVAYGQVLHPHGEDTDTTTGATKDDSAATSTGWTAHLHVTLVDGGSWVVKLQDSANSSDWDDLTGGAFTAATGVTAQRLVSATDSTTLRRYLRYVATRTGGSAGQGITFQLSYARSNA